MRNSASCPTFMPGHSEMGRLATFDSSRVMWPVKPGSMNPAVECVSRPRRPSEDLPSRRPARCGGMVNFSSVDASTNSPGCSTNASSHGTSRRVVSSSCGNFGSMCVYRELLNTRKNWSRRTSIDDGWIISSSNGSMPRRASSSAERAARMSRSESSTPPPYRHGGREKPGSSQSSRALSRAFADAPGGGATLWAEERSIFPMLIRSMPM